MLGNKAKLKASKSQIFLLIIGVVILCALYIKISGSCCNVREVFLGYGEEDDACIAKLVKQADAGDILAANRLRYPHEAYIKRVCEKGVKSLGERERYYFQDFRGDRCGNFGFKTPKSQDSEANTTSGGGNLVRGDMNATDGGFNARRGKQRRSWHYGQQSGHREARRKFYGRAKCWAIRLALRAIS